MKNKINNYEIKLDDIFSSKSNTLLLLNKILRKSKIEKIFNFTVEEWLQNRNMVLDKISEQFDSDIIVRSSAQDEDSFESSKAGIYESILNVNPKIKTKVEKAILSVIQSYNKQSGAYNQNQILIQNQTKNIITSGVLLTKTPDIGSPYYVINYEEGESTIGVTKGTINNIVKIYHKIQAFNIPKKWKRLIASIKEIEDILQFEELDIEFGITDNKDVVIFQVRPITFIPQTDIAKLAKPIESKILKNKNIFSKLNQRKHILGNRTIFSDMSDWNPAEIIGNNPNLLDYSLYDYLIMNKIWHNARTVLGYQNVNPSPLMVKFGNKPYVDARASFNSLIPEKLGKKLASKLVNYYLDTLSKNPHLYDKVEFEILFTCYDFNLDSKLSELEKHGFTKNEIKKIKNVLLDLTNNIISDFPKILKDSQYSMQKLARNRTEIISNLKNKNITQSRYLGNIEKLLEDCKKFGTLPFSIMARIGFIGSILLKSIQKDGYLPSYFENMLLNSLSTPISDIRNDVIALNDKKITKIQFLKKYGHLRPGTYDITALRYDDSKNNFFEDIQFPKLKSKHKFDFDNTLLSNLLTSHFLNFENIDFFSFVRDGLIYREKLKFEFTKNLSEALELIAKVGKTLGFTREDVSNLDIRTILKSKNLSKSQTRNIWREKIFQQQKEKLVNDCLALPPIIFSEKDFDIIQYFISKPNYITDKKITGNIINFENFKGNIGSQRGKILLLQNADPGYDWIFTKKLGGLITKYGGVASHMSIRCSETGLPAAIGCGEVIFEKLKLASKVLLDCKNKEILILEHSKYDEIIEAKNVLKSLGYIK